MDRVPGLMHALAYATAEVHNPVMLRIVYASTLSPSVSVADVDSIVAKAKTRNAELDVTGFMAVEGPSVVQILEGPTPVVRMLFDQIRTDIRHSGVVVLDERDVTQRRFPSWTMARRPMIDAVMLAYSD